MFMILDPVLSNSWRFIGLIIIEHTIIEDNRGGKRPQARFRILGEFVQCGFTTIFAFIIETKSNVIIHTG